MYFYTSTRSTTSFAMSGSTRLLARALAAVFDAWDDPLRPDLGPTIEAFHLRHDSLQAIKQGTNTSQELARVYGVYVKDLHNLLKETFFAEVLTQLLPVLAEEDVLLWLLTYLKPAVDSAGYDLQFVEQARAFVSLVTILVRPTEDTKLAERRTAIRVSVAQQILEVYLGTEDGWKRIQLNGPFDSHEHYERVRFVEKNCIERLREYGTCHPKDFFSMLNRYFILPEHRLKTLTLIASFVSTQRPLSREIVHTLLFDSLLRCLLFDFSESVLVVALLVLSMLLPHICNDVAAYVPDILVIFFRMTVWGDLNGFLTDRVEPLRQFLREKTIAWDILPFDPSTTDSSASIFPTSSRVELNPQVLGTFLYGLFPLNFSRFCQSPFVYLHTNTPKLIDGAYLAQLNRNLLANKGPRDHNLEGLAVKKTNLLFKRFMLHPNFVKCGITARGELLDPLEWVKEDSQAEEVSAEDIALACLCLNPDILITVPELLTSWDVKLENMESTTSSGLGLTYSGRGESKSSSRPDSNHVSRKSSLGGPLYFNAKDGLSNKVLLQKSLQNLSRKMSVVPTNLVIDLQPEIRKVSAPEIQFKEVKFNQGLGQTLELPEDIVKESSTEDLATRNESLGDLFSTHEKLYGLKEAASEKPLPILSLVEKFETLTTNRTPSFIHERFKNDMKSTTSITMSYESTPLAKDPVSLVTSKKLSFDTLTSSASPHHAKYLNGTAVDFYQRELLLIKNELEFSSYMKHLNKFHYIKQKVHMNRILKDALVDSQHTGTKNELLQLADLRSSYNTVLESLAASHLENNDLNLKLRSDKTELVEQLMTLRDENDQLKLNLFSLSSTNDEIIKNWEQASKEILPEKEREIDELQYKLKALEISTDSPRTHHSANDYFDAATPNSGNNSRVNEQEEQIYRLNSEITMLNDRNSRLSEELARLQHLYEYALKNHETRLSSAKLDLNESVNAFTALYEKKIQELNTTILKYEGILEDRNAKIMQLLTSKPISIPGSSTPLEQGPTPVLLNRSSFSRNMYQDYTEMYDTSAKLSSASVNSASTPPGAPLGHSSRTGSTVSQTAPIIRGRGGYQKRSKKHM